MQKTRSLLLLAPIALALALAGCGDKETAAPEAPKTAGVQAVATRIYTTSIQDFTRHVELDGEVANLYSPDVAAEVQGRVTSVSVEPGQRVKAGQELVRLENADLALSVAADKAEVARLMALSSDKAAIAKRLEPLVQKELVSRASYDTARQDSVAASAAVKAALAKSELTERNLHKASVIAPFDAEVAERHVAPGAYVKAGDTLLTLVRTEASFLRVLVPESFASSVKPGLTAQASVAGGAPVETKVTAVRPRTTGSTRAVEATVELPAEALGRPGASARVKLSLGKHEGVAAPETGLIIEADKAFVYVVKNGTAVKTPVKVGARANGLVELTEGVGVGEQVAQDASYLYDGAKVEGGKQ